MSWITSRTRVLIAARRIAAVPVLLAADRELSARQVEGLEHLADGLQEKRGRQVVRRNACAVEVRHRAAKHEWLFLLLYLVAVALAALVHPAAAMGVYVVLAATWFIPDRRIERVLRSNSAES